MGEFRDSIRRFHLSEALYPDPDRSLIAIEPHRFRLEASFAPANAYHVGPVWVLVVLLVQTLAARGQMPNDERIAFYRDACDNLLNHNHEGTGSEAEVHVHLALARFAKLLGVQNA